MPVMDGLHCTREIRLREAKLNQRPTPIIALTANAMGTSIEECFACGMSDYISKPVKIETLKHILQKWLPQ
jgi:CheY-like chemotaxis protein